MQLDHSKITHIKKLFAEMRAKEDLLALLNYAKPYVYGKDFVPFELKQVTWNANTIQNKKRYEVFFIRKKSGSVRTIHSPTPGLKAIQKTLSLILQCVFEPHKAAMGFITKKSIVDNARIHVGSNYVFNIDLKDFFPGVDQARVWKCLQLKPFNLSNDFNNEMEGERVLYPEAGKFLTTEQEVIYFRITTDRKIIFDEKKGNYLSYKKRFRLKKPRNITVSEKLKILDIERKKLVDDAIKYIAKNQKAARLHSRLDLANLIASLCCTEIEVQRKSPTGEWHSVSKNVLPQGAPTSPVISNIVCQKLDFLLSAVSKRFGLKYSRYADDITFSSMHNVYQKNGEFLKEVYRIISEQNFYLNESKTRLQKEAYRQEVTGLVVNEKPNVPGRYIKQLRMWLYYWERYGYKRGEFFFTRDYRADKAHVKFAIPSMENVVLGKLNYLKMVRGGADVTYLGLRKRFDYLILRNNPIGIVLDTWEKEGIEKAMEKYYVESLEKSKV